MNALRDAQNDRTVRNQFLMKANSLLQSESNKLKAQKEAEVAAVIARYDKKQSELNVIATNIHDSVSTSNATIDSFLQTLQDGASMNRANTFLQLLDTMYTCFADAARCGGAIDPAVKAKLLETVKSDCMYIEQMKFFFSNEEYDKIVPQTK